jgi:lipid-A-disaccharide synthase
MQQAGVEITVHYRELAFMGFVSLVTSLYKIFGFLSRCKQDMLQFKPDAVILIDYGGFNLRMARFAKSHGLKVFYYIPPKVWAWNQSRAWKLKANVDHVFSILPFEMEFYKQYSLPADYVGNPVLDAIKAHLPDLNFLSRYGISKDKKLVALLPGSRKLELKLIVPLMAEIATANPNIQFVVAAVNNLTRDLYLPLRNLPNVKFVEGETYNLLGHADAAIVTSGTATLETALFKVPQVVVYKTSGLEYLIVKSLIKVKFISLVNLIANKEVVKEMIQHTASNELVGAELLKLLDDASYNNSMKMEYERLYTLLDTGSASENTARLITQHLNR